MGLDVGYPFRDLFLGLHGTFRSGPGVADHPGGAADQGQRLVSGQLQPAHQQQLDEMPQVQARRSRIETAIVGHRFGAQSLFQLGLIGGDLDQATPEEFLPDIVETGIVLLCSEFGCL